MRILYLLAVVMVGIGLFAANEAYNAYEQETYLVAANEALKQEIAALNAEMEQLKKVDPAPLRYSADSLSEFFSRTVEAGEVLGAGVRVEARSAAQGLAAPMTFTDFRQGVQVCNLTLQAAMEGDQAPAILAMFEEELKNLPAAVRKATARKAGRDVALTMEIDLFGRTP